VSGSGYEAVWTRVKVQEILDAYAGDPEAGHGLEDDLLEQVVRRCAEGSALAAPMAREAVRLLDAQRTRWYA